MLLRSTDHGSKNNPTFNFITETPISRGHFVVTMNEQAIKMKGEVGHLLKYINNCLPLRHRIYLNASNNIKMNIKYSANRSKELIKSECVA